MYVASNKAVNWSMIVWCMHNHSTIHVTTKHHSKNITTVDIQNMPCKATVSHSEWLAAGAQ